VDVGQAAAFESGPSRVVTKVGISSPFKFRAIRGTTWGAATSSVIARSGISSPFKFSPIGDINSSLAAWVGTRVGTGVTTTSESATYGVELGDEWDLRQVYDLAPFIVVVVDGLVFPRVDVYTIFVGNRRVAVFALLFGIGRVAVFALWFGIGRVGAFTWFDIDPGGVGAIFDTGWATALTFFTASRHCAVL
jgi:hypothetical protein